MPRPEPLPFRLAAPGSDTIDADGARSVSYRLDGFLHLDGRMLTLEWAGTQRTQQLSFSGVRDHVDPLPVEWFEIPIGSITDVGVRGGWWRPRLELCAARLDAFDGIPGARPGSVTLRIRRRDRALAAQLVAQIDRARAGATIPARAGSPELGAGDRPRLEDGRQ